MVLELLWLFQLSSWFEQIGIIIAYNSILFSPTQTPLDSSKLFTYLSVCGNQQEGLTEMRLMAPLPKAPLTSSLVQTLEPFPLLCHIHIQCEVQRHLSEIWE